MKKQIIIKKAKSPHLWKIRSVIVFSVFILPILFILMLLYTNVGLKVTMFTLNKFVPELKIEHVYGSLSNLTLKELSVKTEGVTVTIGDASLSLSGLCLLQSKICIKNFDANRIMVKVDTDLIEDDPEEVESNERWLLQMPLPIDLSNTHLTKVDVYVDDMEFGLTDFTGKAIWINEKLYVYPAVAQGLRAIFADDTKDATKLSAVKQNKTIYESVNAFFNQSIIDSLPQVNIPLDVNVTSLTGNNWLLHIGGQDIKFNQSVIQTEMVNNYIRLKRLETDAKSPYADGHVSATGSIIMGDDWPISTNIHAKTEQDELTGQFSGKLLGEFSVKTKVTGLNQLDFNAKVNFVKKYLPIVADVSSTYFRWPFTKKPQYEFENLNFSLNGEAKTYHLLAKSSFKGTDLPNSIFDIVGDVSKGNLNLEHATVKFPQGDIIISGNINWSDILKWDFSSKINRLDLVNELPNYPIKLLGKIETSGKLERKKWLVDFKTIELDGSINHEALFATGAMSINSDSSIIANKLALTWGKNSITMDGATLDGGMQSQVNLASLSSIDDDSSGEISGSIDVKGTIEKPNIKTDLNINNFAWQNIFAKNANVKTNISYQDQIAGKLAINAQNIELLDETISNLDLELSGNEEDHKLKIELDGKPASLITSAIGKINKAATKWDITLPSAVLQFGKDNDWQPNQLLVFSYDWSKKIFTINNHCWLNADAKICLDEKFSVNDNDKTTLTLQNIDLAKLPIPNSGETKLAGNIDGKASIQWYANNKVPTIKLNIDSKNVYIQQMIASQVLSIPFDLFYIDAQFSQKQAKFDWDFSLNEFGKMHGNLTVDDPTKKKHLSGNLLIDDLSLSIINPLLKDSDYATGVISGKVNFSDTLLAPSITGNIELDCNEIKSNQLPADITSALIGINFHGKSSRLNGLLKTKAGNVKVEGSANWKTIDTWKADISVSGAALEVLAPPMLKATIIPNVKMEASQNELILSGTVNIPKGKIVVESLPTSSVDISPDEVMLDKNKQQIVEKKPNLSIISNLEIILGDNVRINAFGLDAALKGKLAILQNDHGFGVNGQIAVPSGRFHAYGQDLLIRKGEITFSGPIEQPLLNIEAIRNPEASEDNVTAGIRVIGLASDPQIEVFSDPVLSKQETLSYLLNGQSLSASSGNSELMTTLLVGLGTSQGGKYIGNVGDLLGIQNLSLDTQGSGDNYQVVVSGYLMPNLQLKYGVGVFDSLATFTFRYRLMPKLYLEAISGVDQTLNFLYQFEF